MDSPNWAKWLFSAITPLVGFLPLLSPLRFPPLHTHNHLPPSHAILLSFPHPAPTPAQTFPPTTAVVTNCTMWTGCAFIVLENKRQKARLPVSILVPRPPHRASSLWPVTQVLLLQAAHNALNTPGGLWGARSLSPQWQIPNLSC